jgi:hypothetical protein
MGLLDPRDSLDVTGCLRFGLLQPSPESISIFTSRDNHVLQAVHDVEIPGCILIADVSGAKQPISKCKRCLFWIVALSPEFLSI